MATKFLRISANSGPGYVEGMSIPYVSRKVRAGEYRVSIQTFNQKDQDTFTFERGFKSIGHIQRSRNTWYGTLNYGGPIKDGGVYKGGYWGESKDEAERNLVWGYLREERKRREQAEGGAS